MKLQVHIRPQKDTVVVFCPDLPGCSASAPSETKALALLRTRVEEYFSTPTPIGPGTRVIELEV